ncbi:hypothetical protein I551_7067 [Mycobacterium ulcerans str. Harvey]|uniref:Uncharacterized protein n=1 Tax=Mycobacterium ulcerans str. Harvey TaxID=1299332 RepID=A0ABP3A9Y2_MYCUL|nr:hypothetical protein I551_7067 [Mycobacterium ulcerans str. Harvey]
MPVPSVSVLPVSSFQRFRPLECCERSELIGSGFSMCWPRCQTRGTHAVGGIR